jgi:hypothetical protein
MQGNGQILNWTGRVLSAEDLRRCLNGQCELIVPLRAVITPLAAEELRAKNVRITRQDSHLQESRPALWGFAQAQPSTLVTSVVRAVKRDGLALHELTPAQRESPCRWAQAVASCIAEGVCRGGIVFCQDGGLICCVANKLPGLRAVPVGSVAQAGRATRTLGANLVAVDLPGPTFYELRQILRTICLGGDPACPPGVACTLGELDGHAHR